jgi:hypothetical protein
VSVVQDVDVVCVVINCEGWGFHIVKWACGW